MSAHVATPPLELLERALDQAATAIANTRPDQAGMPTPCASWDVRALVSHMVRDTEQFTAIAHGGKFERGERDVAPEYWVGEFETGKRDLLEAWRSQQTSDPNLAPRITHAATEFALHAWDLSRATGQSLPLDDEVAEAALAFGSQSLKPEHRGSEASGKSFGPEVSVPGDAPAPDRLAAFFGRQPELWSASATSG